MNKIFLIVTFCFLVFSIKAQTFNLQLTEFSNLKRFSLSIDDIHYAYSQGNNSVIVRKYGRPNIKVVESIDSIITLSNCTMFKIRDLANALYIGVNKYEVEQLEKVVANSSRITLKTNEKIFNTYEIYDTVYNRVFNTCLATKSLVDSLIAAIPPPSDTSGFNRTFTTSGDSIYIIDDDGTLAVFLGTTSKARSAISLTTTGSSGGATYDSLTGIFNIPNYTSIYTGGGNVPNNTYAQMSAYGSSGDGFALGNFSDYTNDIESDNDYGLLLSPDNIGTVSLVNKGAALRINEGNGITISNTLNFVTSKTYPSYPANYGQIFVTDKQASFLTNSSSYYSMVTTRNQYGTGGTNEGVAAMFAVGATGGNLLAGLSSVVSTSAGTVIKGNNPGFHVQTQTSGGSAFDWIEVSMPLNLSTSGNGISFYNNKYQLPNAQPSITNTVKSILTWTGNGSTTTPAFETTSSLASSIGSVLGYGNGIANQWAYWSDANTITTNNRLLNSTNSLDFGVPFKPAGYTTVGFPAGETRMLAYDNTLNILKLYNGTTWQNLVTGTASNNQVLYWNSGVTGSNNFTWNGTLAKITTTTNGLDLSGVAGQDIVRLYPTAVNQTPPSLAFYKNTASTPTIRIAPTSSPNTGLVISSPASSISYFTAADATASGAFGFAVPQSAIGQIILHQQTYVLGNMVVGGLDPGAASTPSDGTIRSPQKNNVQGANVAGSNLNIASGRGAGTGLALGNLKGDINFQTPNQNFISGQETTLQTVTTKMVLKASGNLLLGKNFNDAPSALLNLDDTSKVVLFPRMTTTQRDAIQVKNTLKTLASGGSLGTGYTNGNYVNIALTTTTGIGTGATVNLTVSSGSIVINSVTIVNPGSGYEVGDVLTIDRALLGGGVGTNVILNVTGVFSYRGAFIFNTTQGAINYYTGTEWVEFPILSQLYGQWNLRANGGSSVGVMSQDTVDFTDGFGFNFTRSGKNITGKVDTSQLATKSYINNKLDSLWGSALIFYVSAFGNDTTAQRGNPSRPFLNLSTAVDSMNANSGSWIYIQDGTHSYSDTLNDAQIYVAAPALLQNTKCNNSYLYADGYLRNITSATQRDVDYVNIYSSQDVVFGASNLTLGGSVTINAANVYLSSPSLGGTATKSMVINCNYLSMGEISGYNINYSNFTFIVKTNYFTSFNAAFFSFQGSSYDNNKISFEANYVSSNGAPFFFNVGSGSFTNNDIVFKVNNWTKVVSLLGQTNLLTLNPTNYSSSNISVIVDNFHYTGSINDALSANTGVMAVPFTIQGNFVSDSTALISRTTMNGGYYFKNFKFRVLKTGVPIINITTLNTGSANNLTFENASFRNDGSTSKINITTQTTKIQGDYYDLNNNTLVLLQYGTGTKTAPLLGKTRYAFTEFATDGTLMSRRLSAGSNISLTYEGDSLIIAAIGGSGEVNTASNLGAGTGIFASKSGVDLRFKSLVGAGGTSLSNDANTITITSLNGLFSSANSSATIPSGMFPTLGGDFGLSYDGINAALYVDNGGGSITMTSEDGNSSVGVSSSGFNIVVQGEGDKFNFNNSSQTVKMSAEYTDIPDSLTDNSLIYKKYVDQERKTIFTPTTGGTVTVVKSQVNIINPSGTIATLTINTPASPSDGDSFEVTFKETVTAITWGVGTVIKPITTAVNGTHIKLVYNASDSSWY